jgi:hypothetical protein
MTLEPTERASRVDPVRVLMAGAADFLVFAAVVVTFALMIFPPFTSLHGTEYAFVLTGPEWSRRIGALGPELGLDARIHWPALLVQLGALWALALGARWFLLRPAR